jgi:3-hydroxyisobutyrate dehydrogenase-like beta-hydroxyacid dehydrogenase
MRVAVLGLGAMGGRMAMRLLRAGHTVAVYNRSAPPIDALVAAGAVHGRTPRIAAEDAEIVIAMVRDNEASRTIWCDHGDGALKSLGTGAIAIESSTLTPCWVSELAARARISGAAFLEAPVVGSRPQADSGQLIHLVGGDGGVFDRAKGILSVLGSAAHHVGPVGAGATLKLAVNTLFGTQVAALAEMLVMLRRSGCDPAITAEILASLPITSAAMKGALSLMLVQSDAPLFPIDLVEKDFGYALGQAEAVSLSLPIAAAVHARFAQAKADGLAASNITAVARLYDVWP